MGKLNILTLGDVAFTENLYKMNNNNVENFYSIISNKLTAIAKTKLSNVAKKHKRNIKLYPHKKIKHFGFFDTVDWNSIDPLDSNIIESMSFCEAETLKMYERMPEIRKTIYLYVILLILAMVTPLAHAQMTSNKLSPEILQLLAEASSKEEYSKAGAVILLREGKMTLGKNGLYTVTGHIIGKILDEKAASDYSQISIYFNSYYREITLEFAHTIKSNGEVIETSKSPCRSSRSPRLPDRSISGIKWDLTIRKRKSIRHINQLILIEKIAFVTYSGYQCSVLIMRGK